MHRLPRSWEGDVCPPCPTISHSYLHRSVVAGMGRRGVDIAGGLKTWQYCIERSWEGMTGALAPHRMLQPLHLVTVWEHSIRFSTPSALNILPGLRGIIVSYGSLPLFLSALDPSSTWGGCWLSKKVTRWRNQWSGDSGVGRSMTLTSTTNNVHWEDKSLPHSLSAAWLIVHEE